MGAPISALTAARYMCDRSDWTLTNLKLQKMLYLAQMMYLGTHGERLMSGDFEAWDLGPVVPSVYREARAFGGGPIRYLSSLYTSKTVDAERAGMLDDAVDQLASKTAGQLVNITHWSGGAWAKNYKPGVKGILIPDPDILAEYQARKTQ